MNRVLTLVLAQGSGARLVTVLDAGQSGVRWPALVMLAT